MDFEAMAAALEATGEYRVLRKITPRAVIAHSDGSPTKTALFVDVETTGLDPERNEIIELGMTCAFFVGFGRLGATLHMVEELPSAFRASAAVAPWGNEKIEVR